MRSSLSSSLPTACRSDTPTRPLFARDSNDLERAYGQVEHLQALLGAYERHFGPLEDENRSVEVGEASMECVQ